MGNATAAPTLRLVEESIDRVVLDSGSEGEGSEPSSEEQEPVQQRRQGNRFAGLASSGSEDEVEDVCGCRRICYRYFSKAGCKGANCKFCHHESHRGSRK